jgi:hypothetical protein
VTRSLFSLRVNMLIAQIVNYIAHKCNHAKIKRDMITRPIDGDAPCP